MLTYTATLPRTAIQRSPRDRWPTRSLVRPRARQICDLFAAISSAARPLDLARGPVAGYIFVETRGANGRRPKLLVRYIQPSDFLGLRTRRAKLHRCPSHHRPRAGRSGLDPIERDQRPAQAAARRQDRARSPLLLVRAPQARARVRTARPPSPLAASAATVARHPCARRAKCRRRTKSDAAKPAAKPYVHFFRSVVEDVKRENPGKSSYEIKAIVGDRWRQLPENSVEKLRSKASCVPCMPCTPAGPTAHVSCRAFVRRRPPQSRTASTASDSLRPTQRSCW